MVDGNPYDRSEGSLPPIDEPGIAGYEVLDVLGEGGFGRVYRAKQSAFDREVAIKVLAASGFRDVTARRFERECRAVGALSGHPNIVTLYDSGITPEGRPYIVMDRMSQGSLGDLLTAKGPLDPYAAVDVIVKIAGAVETAHRNGILHRDIKPENILVDGFSEPKLADFGVASIPGGYRTHTGGITASLSHAAPEILEGHGASRAVDIYALGSTLFALISGQPAFEGNDGELRALIARTLTQPVPDLRPLGIADDICRVIEIAMSKDPADRFVGADALGAALQAAQERAGRPRTDMAIPESEVSVITYPVGRDDDHASTALRERRELTPPLPSPPRRRWVWRSPVTAGLIALLLLGSSTGVIALRGRGQPKQPAAAPAGEIERRVEAATAPSAMQSDDEEAAPRRGRDPRGKVLKKRSRKADRESTYGGSYAFSGEGGSAAGGGGTSPPAASQPSSSGDATSRRTGGDSGSDQQKPAPPPPPNEQPATLALYHFSRADGSYYFTADQLNADEQRAAYDNHVIIAAVWRSQGEGLIPLCLTPDRCEGYVSSHPPKKGSYKTLYFYTGSHGRFFTTDRSSVPSDRHAYLYGYVR